MAQSLVSHREWEASKQFVTDQVSVRNLKVNVNAAYDIWGRPKPQPAEISLSLNLSQPFSSAAASDSIDSSTVHYGQLSKSIVKAVQDGVDVPWRSPHELINAVAIAAQGAAADPSIISTLEITTAYPKATRFGEAVRLHLYHRPADEMTSAVLSVDNVQSAALIGVNSNERTMKQSVVISIAVDRITTLISERYFELEQLIEKTAEESSFETLESLAEELAARVIKYFILPKHQAPLPGPAGVRVRIEKPSAVTFADAPVIEVYRSADIQDPFGKRMVSELGTKKPQIPFPLGGRLDEFLQSWKQD